MVPYSNSGHNISIDLLPDIRIYSPFQKEKETLVNLITNYE